MSTAKITAILVSLIVAGPVIAGTLTYTMAGAQFQETSRDDPSDLLELHVRDTVRSARFNRSRGLGDVATTVGGKLIFAGELIDLRTGKTGGRVKAQGFWLAPNVTVNPGKHSLVVHTAQRTCKVTIPHDAAVQSVGPNANAWFAASTERSALFLAEQRAARSAADTVTNSLLPLQLDLATCKVQIGHVIASPGFDYRLQSNGRHFWLSSNVESSLAWSQDGLNWHPIPLPESTHMLLSSYLAADDSPWVAVSRVDKEFALGLYRLDRSNGQWQTIDWDDPGVPQNWLGATREIAAQRALTAPTKTLGLPGETSSAPVP